MLVLTLVFLVVLVLPVVYPELSAGARATLAAIDLGIWAVFLAEYLARLFVAPDRLRFILRNPFDLLLVVIPVLRPLRLLRSVTLIRAARLTRIGAGAGRVARESRVRLASRAALLAVGSAAILILATAVMELDVERTAAKATITTFSDALWWAVSTITTVGYGDHYPVTQAGRAIGIALMIAGVGIFGVVAASAATWFITAEQEQDKQRQADSIAALTAEVTALRQAVSQLSAQLAVQPPRPGPSHRPPRLSKPSPAGANLSQAVGRPRKHGSVREPLTTQQQSRVEQPKGKDIRPSRAESPAILAARIAPATPAIPTAPVMAPETTIVQSTPAHHARTSPNVAGVAGVLVHLDGSAPRTC
jgi:voltage-gated potassium channel